ncbi:MAG TPA: YggS family pyridoxal phosphate-dependent enzyme [Cyanobacteria bacterium UBA8156]|jgi:pyridoxal phosphate enzyme (YggS family)|nr:YggS family pyridoxal phosphate-dependent enzyme [Cyanobacteria bacterium UBA8156]
MTLAERLARLRETLPPHVKLVAVSKYTTAESVREAYHHGLRDFGENRVQDAIAKQEALADLPDIVWHGIGTLQTNKTRRALSVFAWIHSVDRLKLAQSLDRLMAETGANPKLLLQVKLAPDPDKGGWEPDQLWADLPALQRCEHLNFGGLMTILPLGLSPTAAQTVFADVARLRDRLRQHHPYWHNLEWLSMGMSGDYDQAIAAGSNLVRLGTAVFGRGSAVTTTNL